MGMGPCATRGIKFLYAQVELADMERTTAVLLGLLVVAAIVSVAAYPSLPGEMAMQIDVSGDMRNYLPTPITLIVAPLVIAGILVYSVAVPRDQRGRSDMGLLMLAGVLFLVHVGFIFMNV